MFSKRLQMIIDEKKIQKKDLAKVGGVSATSLTYYLQGKNLPSQDTLEKWVRAYGLNGTWLLTGQGSMFREQADPLADPIARRVETVAKTMRESGAAELDVLRSIRAMIDGEIAKAEQAREPDPGSAAGSASA
jgi:transcriptional regulator with XRE-family HTH domain